MFMAALGMIRMIGAPAGSSPRAEERDEPGFLKQLLLGAWRRVAVELRYRRALAELNGLDDRDLDDLALGRGDLPFLARRHAPAAG